MSVFARLAGLSRERKMALFLKSFDISEGTTILDIGGQLNFGIPQILQRYPHIRRLTVLNIEREHLMALQERYPSVRCVAGDARRLPFADKSFDIVFSNAVIEHVGGVEDQRLMAREVQRVGRAWFVVTPNRWYPFEFHTRLPFVGWLPAPLMARAAHLWSYNHIEGRYQSGIRTRTRLLTAGQMRALFRGSTIRKLRVTFWPEAVVAVSEGGAGEPQTRDH